MLTVLRSSLQVASTVHTLSAPPALTLTGVRRIGKSTIGYVTYRTGEYALGTWGEDTFFDRIQHHGTSSVSIGLQSHTFEGNGTVLELQVLDSLEWCVLIDVYMY